MPGGDTRDEFTSCGASRPSRIRQTTTDPENGVLARGSGSVHRIEPTVIMNLEERKVLFDSEQTAALRR